MTRDEKFQIGMALNHIAMSLSDEDFHKVKDYLKQIENIVAEQTEPSANADQHVQYVESVELTRCRKCKHIGEEYLTPIASDGRYYTYVTCTAEGCKYEPKQTESDSEKPNNSKVSEIPTGSTASKMEQVGKE